MPLKSNAPLSIGPGYQQRGIANFFTMDSLQYIDIKTSIPQQSYVMPMIELIGFNYAVAAPIRMAFVIYTYDYLISNFQNGYSGVVGSYAYISSDGYVCLKVNTQGSSYFCGFSMDAYSVAGNGPGYEVGVLAMAASNNAGNVY
jgi:hypothetical protein